ncbi:MAG: hypothetical protein WC683_07590 [bacterium]
MQPINEIDGLDVPLITQGIFDRAMYNWDEENYIIRRCNAGFGLDDKDYNGSSIFCNLVCSGKETTLYVRLGQGPCMGNARIYLNGVAVADAVDCYKADHGVGTSTISGLTFLKGLNVVQIRVEGHNASTDFYQLVVQQVLAW